MRHLEQRKRFQATASDVTGDGRTLRFTIPFENLVYNLAAKQ